MATWYVPTSMGYCGTDEVLEIEADSAEEAVEEAYEILYQKVEVGEATQDEDEAEGML